MLAVTLIVTALDQLSKYYVVETLGPQGDRETVGIIPSVLQFRYVENTGAAFGILQDSTTLLVAVSFGVIGLLAALFWRMIASSSLLGLAFGLQLGGAIGNLIDRVRLGYVVDFIDVPNFPTFNVADSGITVGAVILGAVLLFRPEVTLAPGERVADTDGEGVSDAVGAAKEYADSSVAARNYDSEGTRDTQP